jgi:hypothetical protein
MSYGGPDRPDREKQSTPRGIGQEPLATGLILPDPTRDAEGFTGRHGGVWPLVALSSVACLWFAIWIRHFFASDYLSIATSIQDDSYYYLLPAWNVSRLGSFTFDGVTRTYGFQPLWELLLAALGSVLSSRELFLRLALATSALLYAGAAVITGLTARAVWRTRRSSGGSAALMAAGAALLLNPQFSTSSLTGKENALYAAVFSSLIFLSLSATPPWPLSAKYARGCLAGLALLTRLTPMSVVATMLSYLPIVQRGNRRHLLGNIGAALVVMLPWIVYATLAFGSIMPMSGRVKMEGFWPTLRTDADGIRIYYHATVGYMAAVARFAFGFMSPISSVGSESGWLERECFGVMALVGTVWAFRSRQLYLLLFAAGLAAAYAGMPLMMHQRIDEIYYYSWYIVEIPIVVAILVGVGVEFFLEWLRRYSAGLKLAGALVLVVLSMTAVPGEASLGRVEGHYVDHGQWQEVMLKATLWINRELHEPANTRVGAGNSGLLGWFCKYTVVNFDGLANDDVVAFRRAGGDLAAYSQRLGITVYADVGPPDQIFPQFTIRQTFANSANPEWPTFYVATLPAK